MRSIYPSLLPLYFLIFSSKVFGQCFPNDMQDRSAVELTACSIAEYKRCGELSPEFKSKASADNNIITNDPRYEEIKKSKDFDHFVQEFYENLVATNWNGCKAILRSIEKRPAITPR